MVDTQRLGRALAAVAGMGIAAVVGVLFLDWDVSTAVLFVVIGFPVFFTLFYLFYVPKNP